MDKHGKLFTLKSSDKNFLQRQNDVFGGLSMLQCNLQSSQEMDVDEAPQQTRTVTKRFQGKDSIFKRPREPKNYLRTLPDFKKNPHKWTKYSLADVKDDDMSEAGNTKIALAFLNEFGNKSPEEQAEDNTSKIIFNKAVGKDCSDGAAKPSFRSSKLVMPEYVVGQKAKRVKKDKSASGGAVQLKLDHLLEDD